MSACLHILVLRHAVAQCSVQKGLRERLYILLKGLGANVRHVVLVIAMPFSIIMIHNIQVCISCLASSMSSGGRTVLSPATVHGHWYTIFNFSSQWGLYDNIVSCELSSAKLVASHLPHCHIHFPSNACQIRAILMLHEGQQDPLHSRPF